ncbi:MAG: hypothetical protein KDK08_26715 [Rhizobiaceae bacterium]|nr:hypothetical protein [Rhizobiaceae bacterium]
MQYPGDAQAALHALQKALSRFLEKMEIILGQTELPADGSLGPGKVLSGNFQIVGLQIIWDWLADVTVREQSWSH